MNTKRFQAFSKELPKYKYHIDLLDVELINGQKVSCILLEEIKRHVILDDSVDTGIEKTSVIRVLTLNHPDPNLSEKEFVWDVNQIARIEVRSIR
jgi:hypothetical protein